MNKNQMNTDQLLLIYFASKKPEIWNTNQNLHSYDPSIEAAWRYVAERIHGDRPDVMMLKRKLAALQSKYSTLMTENINIVRTDIPDVTTYGKAVGYDVDLFSVAEEFAMRAIAKMKRVYDRTGGRPDFGESIRKDPEGFKKWGFLKVGGTVEDLKTYFEDANKNKEDARVKPEEPKVYGGFGKGGFFNGHIRHTVQTVNGPATRYETFENGRRGFVQEPARGFASPLPSSTPGVRFATGFGGQRNIEIKGFGSPQKEPVKFGGREDRFDQEQIRRYADYLSDFGGSNSGNQHEPFSQQFGRHFNAPDYGCGFGAKPFHTEFGYINDPDYGSGFGGNTKHNNDPTRDVLYSDSGYLDGFGGRGGSHQRNTEDKNLKTSQNPPKKPNCESKGNTGECVVPDKERKNLSTLREDMENYEEFYTRSSTELMENPTGENQKTTEETAKPAETASRCPNPIEKYLDRTSKKLIFREDLQNYPNYRRFCTRPTTGISEKTTDNHGPFMNEESDESESSSEDDFVQDDIETFGQNPKTTDNETRSDKFPVQTVFGTIQTNHVAYVRALDLLNNEKSLDFIQSVMEKMDVGLGLSDTEAEILAMIDVEKSCINQWKIDNLNKPLCRLNPTEIKWIVTKEKKFDLLQQKILAESIREEQDKRRLQKINGPNVTTAYGSFYVENPETAFAINWLSKHTNMDVSPKEMLLIQSHKHLRNRLGAMLGAEGHFLEETAEELKRNPAGVASEKRAYVEKRMTEEQGDKDKMKEYMIMSGAPKDHDELYFALELLKLQNYQLMNSTKHVAFIEGGFCIRVDDQNVASALTWLYRPANAPIVASLQKQIRKGEKCYHVAEHIVKKLETERSFVMDWRMGKLKGRTDFELNVLVPEEFDYIQRMEKEYREADEVANKIMMNKLKNSTIERLNGKTVTDLYNNVKRQMHEEKPDEAESKAKQGAFWCQEKSNIYSVDREKLLRYKLFPHRIMRLKYKQLEESHDAETVFGTIQTNNEECSNALHLLNNEDYLDSLKELNKKISNQELLYPNEKYLQSMINLEQEFIVKWKKENLNKPMCQLNPAEIKLIVTKEKKFDLLQQKILAEKIRAEQDQWRQKQWDGPNVVTPYGTFYEENPETAFAITWLSNYNNKDLSPEKILYLQHHKHLRNRMGSMLGAEGQFLDNVSEQLKINPTRVGREKREYVKKRLEEKKVLKEKLENYRSMREAPKRYDDVYFALEFLKMQKTELVRCKDRDTPVSDCHRTEFELSVLNQKKSNFKIECTDTIARKAMLEKMTAARVDQVMRKEPVVATALTRTTEDDDTLYGEDAIEIGAEQVVEAITDAVSDISLGVGTSHASVSSDIKHLIERQNDDAALYGADAIEIGAEQVAEEFSEEEFEITGESRSTTPCEMVPETETRSQNLIRMITDVLSQLERSNPAEYQNKESALLRLMQLN